MDLGITGFHDLTSANEKYIVSGKQSRNKYTRVFKKHIVAIAQILQERNSEQPILLNYRKIYNFTGLLDTHTLTHRLTKRCPQIPQTPKPNKLCPSTQHPHHSHAQQRTIGTPLQTTLSEAHHLHTQLHQQVMDTPTDPLSLTHPTQSCKPPLPPSLSQPNLKQKLKVMLHSMYLHLHY